MKKNIVFITAIKVPSWEHRSSGYEFGLKSWKYWCDRNDCELVTLENLLRPHNEMRVNFSRYYVFDLMKESGIEFDQICVVDADSMIHPECPNFFKISDNKLCVTYADGDYDWVARSMENTVYTFPNDFKPFNIFTYFNSGFLIVNESHKYLFDSVIKFHDTHDMNALYRFGIGTDQPILNHIVHKNNTDRKYLPYQFSMVDMPRKKLLMNDLYLRYKGVWQFNAIAGNAGFGKEGNTDPTFQWMKHTYEKLFNGH